MSTDYEDDVFDPDTVPLTLAGSAAIDVKADVFRCTEVLFSSRTASTTLPQAIKTVRLDCPGDVRRELAANVVVSGGITATRGFDTRLERELAAVLPGVVRVAAEEKRGHLVWLGGSIEASQPDFKAKIITQQEAAEFGPGILHSRGSAARI